MNWNRKKDPRGAYALRESESQMGFQGCDFFSMKEKNFCFTKLFIVK